MTPSIAPAVPPDQSERLKALDTSTSVLVEAPAGSGKTSLLTQRFLALLARVDDPRQIVAITFTNAAAAEMRHRILDALASAAVNPESNETARAALDHANAMGWNLLEQPALLRISTIDSFNRELALQQPLFAGMGGSLSIAEQPEELYREAARRTLKQLDHGPDDLREAIATLLLWRDNSWHEIENQLVKMLGTRDRWTQGFVFDATIDDDALRGALERPFTRAAIRALNAVRPNLETGDCTRIQQLAAFAAANREDGKLNNLATCQSLLAPVSPGDTANAESAVAAFQELAAWILKATDGEPRQKWTKTEGFPTTAKSEKVQISELVTSLSANAGFMKALKAIGNLPPRHYSDDEWRIVRACFVLLRHAAAQLKTLFSEVARCDFVEVAQIAEQALLNSEGAFAVADDIRHLLVDEFQDTNRRQHRMLASLIAHWGDREDRTCFLVGDPRQSIYFFRDADAELFPRTRNLGLELGEGDSLLFQKAQLTANFRTLPGLVNHLNGFFERIFAEDDGSGLRHTPAEPAREETVPGNVPHCTLHLEFLPAAAPFRHPTPEQIAAADAAPRKQIQEIVGLVQSLQPRLEEARAAGRKFRIAVLGRAHKSLLPVASALRAAGIPFRAIDLEPLSERPEVTDALILARAILNPEDRVAWLGLLRGPWVGLTLAELHTLTSGDDPALLQRPVAELAASRLDLLSPECQTAVHRVLDVAAEAAYLRASQPTQALGAWLEIVWQRIGGGACIDAQGRANLDLLWAALDQLPNGEQDLLGPALQSALGGLKAQPDPAASNSHGIQLLTIHKAKGLEFEVVIVPELHAQSGGGRLSMLSWLERGLTDADDSASPTEFLVAPFSPKGVDGGAIKKWVDQEYRDREKQEMRRLLYVAATRARDELHLFARPCYREEDDGGRTLAKLPESLLATAWPAVADEVRRRFEALQPESVGSNANMTAAPTSTILRRLPTTFTVPGTALTGLSMAAAAEGGNELYTRENGSAESRVLGVAVHSVLERLAIWRAKSLSWDVCRTSLDDEQPRLVARMRAAGLSDAQTRKLSATALTVALDTTHDPYGQWILDSHPGAASEVSWTGVLEGQIRTVQADRVFLGGSVPGQNGSEWWVVDFKTAVPGGDEGPETLATLRSIFSPQLEVYARVLRQLHGNGITVHAGLYYPRMKQKLDHWEVRAF